MSKDIAELHTILRFQAHATAIGMYFLISKGLINIDEYNDFLKEAEKNLKLQFKDDEDVNFKDLIEKAFSGFYIPDNVGSNTHPSEFFN